MDQDQPAPRPLWTPPGQVADWVLDEPVEPPRPAVPPRRVGLPMILFALTWVSVFFAAPAVFGAWLALPRLSWGDRAELLRLIVVHGWKYAVPLMTILICHEAGHFLQARRYGIRSSLPYFIPMPFSPIGTLGAVIGMDARIRDRRALFDVGISGPLAGLVPTLICCVVGVQLSEVVVVPPNAGMMLGDSLFFSGLVRAIHGPIPTGMDVFLHPMAYAGWVGMLITSLNLIPVGQLDGGHILYALLRRRAHLVARLVLWAAAAAVLVGGLVYGRYELLGWLLMLFLLFTMGHRHPPTADDSVPLGPVRVALGWLTLAFMPLGFTPIPFIG